MRLSAAFCSGVGSRRLGLRIKQALLGEFRDAGWRSAPEGFKQPGDEDF